MIFPAPTPMRLNKAKTGLVKLASPLGGYQLSRWLTRNVPKILMYHRFSESPGSEKVSAATFRHQLTEIQRRFRVMALEDVVRVLRNGNPLPAHVVVLTIDDGYRDFFTVAYPILRELQLPATVFVATDFIDRRTWLWPDIVTYCLAHSDDAPGRICRALDLDTSPSISRNEAWVLLVERCLSIPDDERRRLLERLVSSAIHGSLPDPIPKEYEPMSWDEIRELHANGIEIGGHSRSHPNLAKVPANALENEILGCKKRIEEELGTSINSFCYPNGTRCDYNDTVRSVVVESGFIGAAVAFYDAELRLDLYELRRFSASENTFQFRKALYGIEYCGARMSSWLPRRQSSAPPNT